MGTTQISVRLTSELLRAIDAAAKAEGLERGEFLRRTLAKRVGMAAPEMPQGFQLEAVKKKAIRTQRRKRREKE